MPHIAWVNEDEATGDVANVYDAWKKENPGRTKIPGILKCFSARPDFLQSVIDFSDQLHFSDGHLTWQTKELIATFVSGLNECRYCAGSHAFFLQYKGGSPEVAQALRIGDLDSAPVTNKERALLAYVERITNEAYKATAEDVEQVRQAGWTEEQIAEAVYITALFCFFNRVANAFGLEDPGYDKNSPLVAKS